MSLLVRTHDEMTRYGAKHLVFLLAMLFGSAGWACDREPAYVQKTTDGRTFAIFMTKEQVWKSPAWNDNAVPAMTWMRASDFLIAWARKKYESYDEVKYYQIQIESFPCPELHQHRFYVFQLSLQKDGKVTRGGEHFGAVLLDGTVFGPTHVQ